jgi:hypothetical protein
MRTGLGVACIVGIAIVLMASGGFAVNASETSGISSHRKAHRLSLFSTVQAVEPSLFFLHQGQFQHASYQRPAVVEQEIHSTSRISIPFGITTPLPLHDLGRRILVAGHGGCTENQQVTVQITLMQTATAALATGQTQEVCTGQLQLWSSTAVVTTGVPFVAEPAQVCGVAETREGDAVTDRFEWCRDVDLAYGLYLPMLLQD